VVVEIDSTLRIANLTSKFAALMMSGPDQPSKGRHLRHFMASDEDLALVEECLQSSSNVEGGVPLAGVVHAKMRDSIGNILDMEIFHASFEGLDGRPCHVAGIREFAEPTLAPLRSEVDEDLTCNSSPSDDPDDFNPSAGRVRLRPAAASPPREPANAKGTPPQPPRGSLQVAPGAAQEAPPSLSGTLSDRSSRGLVVPAMRQTSDKAMMIALMDAVQYWNVKMHRRSCCPLHATIKQCVRTANLMNRRACISDYTPQPGTIQCDDCGILGWEEEWNGQLCTLCSNTPSEPTEKETIMPL